MEILALLFLGLIAMLAIVPPIIRGKLEESPLATSQSFQRSMQEMGNSLDFHRHEHDAGLEAGYRAAGRAPGVTQAGPEGRRPLRAPRRNRAAVRRNRIMAGLALFAAIWGMATLVSGCTWCLVLLAISSVLFLVYWALSLLAPFLLAVPRMERREEGEYRHPKSQAM